MSDIQETQGFESAPIHAEYTDFLTNIANERPADYPYPPPQIGAPQEFFHQLMLRLSACQMTRTGLDNMLDAVFDNQSIAQLLDNVSNFLDEIHDHSLPQCPERFRPYWIHIILPAIEQHARIRRVLKSSVCPQPVHD
jgi:hypothetical protein